MSVRLNKVCRELNIGFQTISEFLSSKGFEIELNPNFKLTDEQASLVYKHFSDKEYIPRPKPIVPINNSSSSDITKISPLEDYDWEQFEESLTEESSEDSSSSSSFHKHDIVSAIVISLNRREIVVNLGHKINAIIPASELKYNPDLKVGDQIDVYIEENGNNHGQFVVSHRKARLSKAWDKINEVYNSNETIKVYVKSRTKGGLIVDALGMEAFLPGSQIDIVKVFDYDSYIGKTLDVKVIKINTEYKNVVVSHKEVVSENLQKRSTDKTLLKDIWQKHTEVQEHILRQRTEPISIVPSLTTIVNEKLHVRIDTSDNTDFLKSRIMDSLAISDQDCHFDDGYVFAPYKNWSKLDEREKSRISTQANKEYISFSYYPVIDGKITDSKAQFTGVRELLDKLIAGWWCHHRRSASAHHWRLTSTIHHRGTSSFSHWRTVHVLSPTAYQDLQFFPFFFQIKLVNLLILLLGKIEYLIHFIGTPACRFLRVRYFFFLSIFFLLRFIV